MPAYTRLSLARDDYRVDLVVASDQPLAALMPQFVDLLQVPVGSGPFSLARVAGDTVDLAADCVGNRIVDGEALYLVDQTQAPAPPAVSDVTDLVAGLSPSSAAPWAGLWRQVVSALVVGCLTLLTGWSAPWGSAGADVQLLVLGGLLIVLTCLAVWFGRTLRRPWPTIAACAAAVGLVVPSSLAASSLVESSGAGEFSAFGAATLTWLVLGVGAGVGLRMRAVTVAAVTCGLISLVGCGLLVADVSPLETWGVVGLAWAIMLGLVPSWAISVSGLTGLDDFTASGPVARADVVSALRITQQTVTWCVVGAAAGTGVAAVLLARSGDVWGMVLAGLLSVVVGLRARMFTAAAQVGAPLLATAAGLAALVGSFDDWWALSGLLGIAVVVAVAVVVQLPQHVAIRVRGLLDLVEKLCMAAALPVLLGIFGVYPWLLGAFS